MVKKKENHISYYIALVSISLLILVLVSLAPSKQLQMMIVVMGGIIYVSFGILHHLINHDLTVKIVIEYVLIASFGLAVILLLLKGGFGL